MNDRDAFKRFIEETVAPNTEPSIRSKDLRVDTYGNFEVYFTEINKDFAESPRKYSPLGDTFFDGDVHRFIQKINDVEMTINEKPLSLPGMSYAIHRLMPMNNPNSITMNWLSTKTPFIETLFVPWMQANTMGGHLPLVKVNMKIKFPLIEFSLRDQIEFKYYGIRPIEISLHKMTNEAMLEFYRKVTFDFDYFWVENNGVTL